MVEGKTLVDEAIERFRKRHPEFDGLPDDAVTRRLYENMMRGIRHDIEMGKARREIKSICRVGKEAEAGNSYESDHLQCQYNYWWAYYRYQRMKRLVRNGMPLFMLKHARSRLIHHRKALHREFLGENPWPVSEK